MMCYGKHSACKRIKLHFTFHAVINNLKHFYFLYMVDSLIILVSYLLLLQVIENKN